MLRAFTHCSHSHFSCFVLFVIFCYVFFCYYCILLLLIPVLFATFYFWKLNVTYFSPTSNNYYNYSMFQDVLSKAEKTKVIFNLTRNPRVGIFSKKLKQRLNSKCSKDPLLKKGLCYRFTSDGHVQKNRENPWAVTMLLTYYCILNALLLLLLLHSECLPKISLVTMD